MIDVRRVLTGAIVLGAACGWACEKKSEPSGGSAASASAAAASAAPAAASGAPSSAPPADEEGESPPCVREKFETKLVEAACAEGGQRAAAKAMKEFMKEKVKPKDPEAKCKICHEKMKPNYENTDDALEKFKEFGGE